MKTLFIVLSFSFIPLFAIAQTMKDILRTMPDSITPLLSHNTRLDFIDYIEAGQKAEEKNLLGGKSKMTHLTDTRAIIQMSPSSLIDIKLLTRPKPQIGIITTVKDNDKVSACILRLYTLDWHLVKTMVPCYFESIEWQDNSDTISQKIYDPLKLE